MELSQLVDRFPRLWHATFPGGWNTIRTEGLFPASDLLAGAGRSEATERVRPDILTLGGADGASVVLRDQKPGRSNLAPHLDGVSPAEWWDLLNRRVYLFPTEAPLRKLLASYADRGFGQEVIAFDTRRLLAEVVDRIEVTSVNAGVFPRVAGRTRGLGTFQPLADAVVPVAAVKEVTVVGHLPVSERAVVKVVAHDVEGATRRLFP